MPARFSAPVLPGKSLTVRMWTDGATALFRTVKEDGTVVIDRGTTHLTDSPRGHGRPVACPNGHRPRRG
ncbi:hypothetical protein ABT317_31810, partial [Streptomyces carpinensis]